MRSKEISRKRKNERGAIGILFAFALVMLFGVGAFVLDIGSGLVTRAELQNVGDAGSLAASRELAIIYSELPHTVNNKTYQLTSDDQARLLARASGIAIQNKAGGVPVNLLAGDLVYGTYDHATGEITPTTTGVRAVSLLTRRDASVNGVLPTTLGRILGFESLSASALSASGLTALGTLPEGEGDIPVGISSHWFENHACGPDSNIRFFPTGDPDGCAGWHSFTEYPANAARLGNILDGLTSGGYSSPETTAGETSFNFIGGAVASRFKDMQDLYDAKKDLDGNWTVLVPVYQDDDCSNPSGAMEIVGFVHARIFEVSPAPDLRITANVECGVVNIGSGNGPNDYGTLYGSPAMIQ